MAITLRQLGYFVALAENGNFGRAAAVVNISQPALSVQIRELEAQLGSPLVERGAREILLTHVGREVLVHARRVLGDVEALKQAARWKSGLAGRLLLGVIPTVAPYLLPVALPLLRQRNIEMELRVREAQTEKLLADLNAGLLDAAVIALPSGADNLFERHLFDDCFLLAGSQRRIADWRDRGKTLRPTGLDADSLLLLDEGHCLADQALDVCSLDRTRTRVDLGASSLSTLCGLVAEGFGVTFLPEIACKTELAAFPHLETARFADPEPKRQIGLVRRQTSVDDGWYEELADLLVQAGKRLIASAPVA